MVTCGKNSQQGVGSRVASVWGEGDTMTSLRAERDPGQRDPGLAQLLPVVHSTQRGRAIHSNY